MKIKSQSSIEFIILLAFVLFFFTLFFIAIQGNISDNIKTSKESQIREIALSVQDEINMASKTSNGYHRNFKIPTKVNNEEYSISLVDNLVYVTLSSHSIALPIQEVNGEIAKGDNTIKKENGQIYLNQ